MVIHPNLRDGPALEDRSITQHQAGFLRLNIVQEFRSHLMQYIKLVRVAHFDGLGLIDDLGSCLEVLAKVT